MSRENFEAIEDALVNYNNYYIYADMIKNRTKQTIDVLNDININNIEDHIQGVFNILKDGIESEFIHDCKITLQWENNIRCDISIIDYWINLFMWSMILKTNHPIRPKHIFMGSKAEKITGSNGKLVPWEMRRKDVRNYVNKFVLTLENKVAIGNYDLNIILADGLWKYSYFEHFAYYLANTINNEDDIALMRACPEFDALKHISLYGTPIEQVKDEGMKATLRAIELIKDSERYIGYEHGLTNSFRANEAVNPRQYKEACLNIGTKPNAAGSIYPYIIDKNFSTGGVCDALSYFIESSTARTAQILSKINVGDSGELARTLGLNNTDTILNPNPDYACNSQHYMKYEIKSKKHLSMIKGRYYRFNPKGLDYLIDESDMSMVGKTVYLHSPMTCASNSSGHGICKRCYGILYYTNCNINIGKYAAEKLSSQLTQRLLSAKHLLETIINAIKWNAEFKDYMVVDINSIRLSDEFIDDNDSLLKKYFIIINPDDIQLVSDEEDSIDIGDDDSESLGEDNILEEDSGSYNEYITSFIIRTPNDKEIKFTSEEQIELYISQYLNTMIRKKAVAADGKVYISLANLTEDTLFYIKINNNEISKTMNDIINVINKSSITENMTKDEALQSLVDLIVVGDLDVDSVHLEVILSNQIVSATDILKKPNWNDPNVQYRMFTLNQALTNNPSVIISLLYKDLHKTLYNPLTFTKNAPSFFDLFFCTQPQNYMSDEILTDDTTMIRDYENGVQMYHLVDGPNKEKELDDYLNKMVALEEAKNKKKEDGK